MGHKQFIENRVEEENDSKLFNEQQKTALENDDSFKLKSIDQDTLIHEQMKSVLDSSLLFVREKLKDLNENDRSADLDTDQQLESLIKNHRYNRKNVPPIINSERFKTEIFDIVKQNSTPKPNLRTSRSQLDNSIETKSTNTETSSMISDPETNLNERILEINENKFIERLNANLNETSTATKRQSSASFANDEQSRKEVKVNSGNLVEEKQNFKNSTLKSPNLLDESQVTRDALRNDLDAIFGKASKVENLKNSNSSKNKIFDDDSDDELFLPTSTQTQKLADSTKEKLFKIDKFSSNESIDKFKTIDKTESKDLFDSNVKSSDFKNKKTIDKLFDSDSDDDNIFATRLPKNNLIDKDNKDDKQMKSENKLEDKPTDKPAIKSEDKLLDKPIIKSENKLFDEVKKVDLDIKSDKDSTKETSSNIESSTNKQDNIEEKMSSKKDLFKNQLEDLFSKKRNLNQGFIKVDRKEEDLNDNLVIEDNEKENVQIKTPTTKLSTSSASPILSPINKQRKEFDLFSSKPSDDPILAEDLNFKTSTLDNNLIKSRVKFTNRKRPSKQSAKTNYDSQNETKTNIPQPVTNARRNDLDIIDEGDLLFKTPSKESSKLISKEKEVKPVQSESEQIVKEKEAVKVIKPTKIENEPLPLAKESVKSANPIPKTKKALFIDSDEEDDKEFRLDKKLNEKKNLNETLDKKFEKLFEDSDDEDLLFKPSSKAPTNAKSISKETDSKSVAKEINEVKKKALTLFDDSDSDDELFKS